MKLDEKEVIRLFIAKLKKNNFRDFGQNDVTVVPIKGLRSFSYSQGLVLKCDMLVESTDVPALMAPWQIARKSVVSVISDLSAKGAKPYVSLISLGLPVYYSKKAVASLVHGFSLASREFDFVIAGGDTNQTKELIIDCCIMGFTSGNNLEVPGRNGACSGDLVVVSGLFGYPPAGLKIIMDGVKATDKFRRKAVRSVLRPEPRMKFGSVLSKYFTSSIDSSDGLSTSLYELAKQSNVDFFLNQIPCGLDLLKFANDSNLNSRELIFHGGEEFEIVCTIPKSKFDKFNSCAKRSRLPFLVIGEVKNGSGNIFLRSRTSGEYALLENRGYTHLS
ncbi:MAG TPA: thiamine-phosphate kinase [Nitrososphaeraceae archaeon]|jgi:thiamine-monophosphate kinase